MPRLSIIIPFYNTGAYLHKCVQSVLQQDLADIELILVDDGSVDDSGSICDSYSAKDKRVKVIHKQNEGVSVARNTGIRAATGDYIGFVDSDDWIEKSMYQNMLSEADRQNADVVMCDATTVYDSGETEADTITRLPQSVYLKKRDIKPDLLREMAGSAWRCIYRRRMLCERSVFFPQNIPLSEDRIFNLYAFGAANGVYYIKSAYYNRFVRKSSAVHKYYENYVDILCRVRRETLAALDAAWGGDMCYKRCYEMQTAQMAQTALYNVFHKDGKLSFKQKLRAIRSLCNNAEVREGLKRAESKDLRTVLMQKRCVLTLYLIAMLLNKKHGR